MKINFKICNRCNQNARRVFEGMCGPCWRHKHAGAKLPRADCRAPRIGRKRKRRWRRMPESEKLKLAAAQISRLEARAKRLEQLEVEDPIRVSDFADKRILSATEVNRLKQVRKIRYVKQWRRSVRDRALRNRLCDVCKKAFSSSRRLIVVKAYATKQEYAQALARSIETGELLLRDKVHCIACHRKSR